MCLITPPSHPTPAPPPTTTHIYIYIYIYICLICPRLSGFTPPDWPRDTSAGCLQEMKDSALAALVARTKRAHEEAAAKVSARPPPPTASTEAPAKRPKLAPSAPAPRFAERDMFMSASASKIHSNAPARPTPRPAAAERGEDALDVSAFAKKVEKLGASRLEGLDKKDQQARMRMQLGLREQKAQKMPYKRLLAVRKKQKKQDEDMADLARQAGMAPRRKPQTGGASRVAQAGGGKAHHGDFSFGEKLRGGVLHVSNTDIKRTRFVARSAERKKTSSGGKGKGRGGGGGRGRGGGGKGRGGRR